jgi:hypothetical protein
VIVFEWLTEFFSKEKMNNLGNNPHQANEYFTFWRKGMTSFDWHIYVVLSHKDIIYFSYSK